MGRHNLECALRGEMPWTCFKLGNDQANSNQYNSGIQNSVYRDFVPFGALSHVPQVHRLTPSLRSRLPLCSELFPWLMRYL